MMILLILALAAGDDGLRLPRIFSDRMILQQDAPLPVWGWAPPGTEVAVELGAHRGDTMARSDGSWRVVLPPMKADGRPRDLVVRGAGTRVLKDVVLGEVWLCAGQSNMNRGADLTKEAHPDLRLFWIDYSTSPNAEDLNAGVAGWVPSTPAGLASAAPVSEGPNQGKPRTSFSEVGHHFGRRLQAELGVPVGLIVAAVGGSKACAWTPLDVPAGRTSKPAHTPGLLYHSMIHGLAPFAIRGVVWYQGEDDGRSPDYGKDLEALIRGWRARWGNDALPFYLAQVAATTYAGGMLGVWEGQQRVVRTLPHVALAASNDIYDGTPNQDFAERPDPATGWPLAGGGNPHPTNRTLVARRMADLALAHTYGRTSPPVDAPRVRAHRFDGPRAIVEFEHTAGGLRTRDGREPDWFELHDGTRWVKAAAGIVGHDRIEVTAPGVDAPVGVRLGWHPLARWNLINDARLPALPFRAGGR